MKVESRVAADSNSSPVAREGAFASQPTITQHPEMYPVCRACGKTNTEFALFCGYCGRPVGRTCTKCNHPIDEDHAFCPGCGSPLRNRSSSPQLQRLETHKYPGLTPQIISGRVNLWRNPAFLFVVLSILVAGLVVLASRIGNGWSQSSEEGFRSWDLILTPEELDAVLDSANSRDFDYRLDYITYLGAVSDEEANSSSQRSFFIELNDYENLCIDIVVCKFQSSTAAQQVMAHDRVVHLDPSFEMTAGQGNPFLSEEIDIAAIGDQSFCYKWSSFTPTIELRVDDVQVTVQTRIIVPSINRSYGSSGAFEIALEVAEQQASKIQSVLNQ
jgi:hypothetical protein